MKRVKLIYALMCLIAMTPLYAAQHKKMALKRGTVKNQPLPSKQITASTKHWFFAPALGLQNLSVNRTINVRNGSGFSPPSDVDAYTTKTKAHASVDLTGGYLWQNDKKWFPIYALGLRYQHIFSTDLGDNIIQYTLPQFTTYRYQWNVSADVFQAIAKINVIKLNNWLPYISAGLGISFNRAEEYSESAYPDVIPRDTPGFANKTNAQLAYSLGMGCDYLIKKNVTLNLGYEYQHLGDVTSGFGTGTWSGEQLKSGALQSHVLLLGLTDVIG